jgi:xanthine dehydrogenase molybdenum-binding subunit
MSYLLLGQNFVPPDVHGKVTGEAKYAEDFRAEGMVFCRLMLSPMPHARVRSIDASRALAMDGVLGILTADDVPAQAEPNEPILTNNPRYVGAPILAVAAVTEQLAQDAIDAIRVDLEPLPFTVDPLESLFPGGPDARTDGNCVDNRRIPGRPLVERVKWTARDFADAGEGRMPMGQPHGEWSYGDLDAAFAESSLVLDESFVTANLSHHSLEPRSSMAYWENGRCFVYASTQSQSFTHPALAGLIGISPDDLVMIAETCGGGFGSKAAGYPCMSISAHMARRVQRPVMLRISRAEEYFLGAARCGFQGRIRMGFLPDGRVNAVDMYVVQENGPSVGFPDWPASGDTVSLLYQPDAMRWRGISVATNTPPRSAQRGPGYNQTSAAIEPILDKAARQLGIDRLEIRRINSPPADPRYGANRAGRLTSCYMREVLDIGEREFNWAERRARSGQRNGSKVRSVGVGQAYHPAGQFGFDGLVRITPDGVLHIHTGVGNLGTFSHSGTSRIAAEVLKADWEQVVIERGDSRRHLPWNLGQFGSNTSFTMARTNYVAAMDALTKLKEIAARDLGGSPDDYEVGNQRVFRSADSSVGMSFAQAAQRAIELGGRYDGHELPDDINPMTRTSATALAGSGLVGVARDNLPIEGSPAAFTAGFIEIELDTETGRVDILDYVGVADCGTVIHPQSLESQILSGAVMGFGMAASEHFIYDHQNGLPANIGLYQAKPPSFLDTPASARGFAVNEPDPHSPLGTKGVGEPVMGCATAALLCAISDALGGHYFNRTPITPDMIVNAAAGRSQSHGPLDVNSA